MKPIHHPPIKPEMQHCIGHCIQCHHTCLATISYCLHQGGKHAAADHLRLMMDCSQICTTSADFMLRGSPLHHFTCGACAEVCKRCAEDCDKMADDATMKKCAEACHQCAESCSEMSHAMM